MASPFTTSTSSDRPSLAVIVPVYNEAATIADALERVFERGRPDQVIVIDDGSTDDRLMVPTLRAIERHVQMPLGQSLLAVVRR